MKHAHNKPYTTVGIDPGTRNFAVVALNPQGNVVFARMVNNTIRSMARVNASRRIKFRNVMRRMLAFLNPKCVLAEEFVARGFGTQLTQVINLMLGSIMAICDELGCEEHSCQASLWKKNFNKYHDLTKLYEYGRSLGLPDHIVDATCMASFIYAGWTFEEVSLNQIRKRVSVACRLLPAEHHLSERKRSNAVAKEKTKHELSSSTKRKRRRVVSEPGVLAMASKSQRKLRRRGHRDDSSHGEGYSTNLQGTSCKVARKNSTRKEKTIGVAGTNRTSRIRGRR